MKVSLLFFGQPRFLDRDETSGSHYEYIIWKYFTDIFVHAWWSRDLDMYTPSPWSSAKNIPCDRYTIKKITDIYEPKYSVYECPITFSDDLYINNAKSQFYSIKRVGEIFQDYTDPNEYDFIILSRFDNIITSFPDLNELDKGVYKMEDHPGVPDQLFILSPEYLPFLNAYDAFDEIWPTVDGIEATKQEYFFRTFPGENIKPSKFTINLAR